MGACGWGKYTRSYDGTKTASYAAVNHKVDKCSRFSECQYDIKPDGLNGKKLWYYGDNDSII